MSRVRLTYKSAYHHIISRGIKGEDIFPDRKAKDFFLSALKEKSEKLKVRIFAYCIMDNHYHLVLQNTSNRLSSFVKQLNGQYGMYYRKREGGKGYVFQGRYKSTLIQEDNYLIMAIVYVLLNPVRARIVEEPMGYQWSSIHEYFSYADSTIVDNGFVEGLLKSRGEFAKLLEEWRNKDIEVKRTRMGAVLGDRDFVKKAKKEFDRRKVKGESKRRRKEDYIFEPTDEVIKGFEKKKGVKVKDININRYNGKRLRAELLVLLKDRAGLKYTEILKYPLFCSLKYSSLGNLYKRARKKMEENTQ
ncbi:transposase [candidate division WOR-3 bacterium]|nr:transposase [candidate division WOR-3 bacterium]MCK4528802.1 transposase [candidate division WOR-3 bacterium]